MIELNPKPADRRHFFHKRIIGAVTGAVGGFVTGGVGGALGGAAGGFARGGSPRFTGSDPGAGLGQPRQSTFAPSRAIFDIPLKQLIAEGSARSLAEARRRGLAAPLTTTSQSCRFPKRIDPRTGECKIFIGRESGIDRPISGGISMRDDEFGEAVIGAFNMPALVPAVVGQIERRDGTVGPILRCPRGSVLATDDLCYSKGIKGLASHRKWKPGRAPFLPGRDLRALDRVAALKGNKVLKGRIKALGLC